MLKQMVTYEGHDGVNTTRTLYFNLTRFEIAHDMELELLQKRFEKFQEEVIGDTPEGSTRQMTPPEIREMLDIFKVIIKHSYGVRSEDGKRFSKNEEIWDEFVETGAFDAFIFYMFEDANRANVFMSGIWPKEIQEAAAKIRAERPDISLVPDIAPDVVSGFAFKAKIEDYSQVELESMPDDEFEAVFRNFSEGRNVPFPLLIAGGNRKSKQGETE